MPRTLRARAGLFALFAIFLIPVGMASLRGLTQVVTCEGRVESPFTIQIGAGAPLVITSNRIEPGDERGVCGGLLLDVRARADGPSDITMLVDVTNRSDAVWRGTMQLRLGNLSYAVPIGRIDPGETGSAELPHRLDPGVHELSGSLFIGPAATART